LRREKLAIVITDSATHHLLIFKQISLFLKRSRFFSFVRERTQKKEKLMKNQTSPLNPRMLFLFTLPSAAITSLVRAEKVMSSSLPQIPQ
jgi:hypothetical protein